jgi:ribosomal protein S18 acetylase RimI-like enzyme
MNQLPRLQLPGLQQPGLPPPELSFRQAKASDIDTLLRLRAATMTEHQLRAGAPSDDDFQMSRVLYRLGDAQLAFLGSEMVGLLKAHRTDKEWMLVQVQVVPERQGQGLGAALVNCILRRAREDGYPVMLDVLKGNPAKRLYERLGFVVTGEEERTYLMRWTP